MTEENKENDPLDALIVDETEKPDLALLAKLLTGNVVIAKTGDVSFSEKFDEQTESNKIVLFLLASKVMAIKNIKSQEQRKSTEIADIIHVKPNAVRARISGELSAIVKSDKGYYIPNYNLSRCKSLLEEK